MSKRRRLFLSVPPFNINILYFSAVYILGLIIGTVGNFSDSFFAVARELFVSYFNNMVSGGYFHFLYQFIKFDFIFLASVFLIGLFSIGQPLCYFIMFLRGVAYGAFAGFVYSCYDIYGFCFYCACVLVPSLLMLAFDILCCDLSFCFSGNIFNVAIRGRAYVGDKAPSVRYFKVYIIAFIVFTVYTFVFGTVDYFLYRLFSF